MGKPRDNRYMCWYMMIRRCHNPEHSNYCDYGEKGIEVCPEWFNSFEQFCKDVGPRPSMEHTLDRIDGTKGYYPENVRWADRDTQANNKSNSVMLTLFGRTLSLSQWARLINIPPMVLIWRIRYLKWSVDRAFLTPVRPRRKK